MRYAIITILALIATAYDQILSPLLLWPISAFHLNLALLISVILMFDLSLSVFTALIIALVANVLPSPHAWTLIIIYPLSAIAVHFIITSLFPRQNIASFITGTIIAFIILSALLIATTFLLEIGEEGYLFPSGYWQHLATELMILTVFMVAVCIVYQRSLARQQTLFLGKKSYE